VAMKKILGLFLLLIEWLE